MKTLKQLFSVVVICIAAVISFSACVTETTDDNANFVPFNITYSTGEAVWSETNPEPLVLNKLGVGTTGTVPYLEVSSSTYWTVAVDEASKEWLSVSPLGGPQPALSVTNVYLTLSANSGEDREGVITFTQLGKTYQVVVKQRGPLTNANESRLVFVADNFGGKNLQENTVVKFYTFTGDNGGKSYSGIATAGDLYAYARITYSLRRTSLRRTTSTFSSTVRLRLVQTSCSMVRVTSTFVTSTIRIRPTSTSRLVRRIAMVVSASRI